MKPEPWCVPAWQRRKYCNTGRAATLNTTVSVNLNWQASQQSLPVRQRTDPSLFESDIHHVRNNACVQAPFDISETLMKQSKSASTSPAKKAAKMPTQARGLHTPLDLHRFPLNPQADSTPNRETVRETAHPVTAPRQTQRRAGKAKKSQTGG
jgi:hypothetical protein